MSDETTEFSRIGGEVALRAIIRSFTDTMFNDVMIGFHFMGKDLDRIREMEYQHAAAYLGGPVEYTGRPLGQAHKKVHILGGQFARRKKILENTLEQHGVDEAIRKRWLDHVESLRDQILGPEQTTDDCDHEAALRWNKGD